MRRIYLYIMCVAALALLVMATLAVPSIGETSESNSNFNLLECSDTMLKDDNDYGAACQMIGCDLMGAYNCGRIRVYHGDAEIEEDTVIDCAYLPPV